MALKSGDIVEDYPYLWLRQHEVGESEGRKPRPVCVAIAVKDKTGRNHLALLPISSQRPSHGQPAIKLSAPECKAIGLDAARHAWIYLGEYNYDIEEKSYYLPRSSQAVRSVSPAFRKKLAAAFSAHMGKDAKRVSRV